jgi:hypothetical protein
MLHIRRSAFTVDMPIAFAKRDATVSVFVCFDENWFLECGSSWTYGLQWFAITA